MSLTVKVYLENDEASGRHEIRRFAVEQDVSTSFAYIQKKVAQVFPGLETKPFTLYWKDPEDDYITFSSDNELFEALAQLKEDIFRVYVKVNQSSEEKEKVHHQGVVCDACDGAVHGVRFKCSVCPDYDLCEQCSGKGLHSEHEMIRIRTPAEAWIGFMGPHCRGRRGFHGGRGGFWRHGPHGRGHQGPGHHGPGPHGHGPHGFGPHGPGPHGSGPHGNDPHFGFPFPPHFGHWMSHAMGNFWQPHTPQENKQNGEKDGAAADAQTEKNAEQNNTFGADYLRTVGETVAAMLDPMGIDVEIDVEHGDTLTRCGRGAQQKPEQQNSTAKTEQKDVEMKEGESVSDKTEYIVPAETGAKNQADSPKKAKDQADGGWTILQQDSANATPSAPSSSNQGGESSSHGETLLYPSLPPEDPRIAELLTQMQAMGFNNEGGWLTQLLIAKQGDIGKVLDALQPAKHT